MKIERVSRFRVDGQEFATLAKAQDHVEGMIDKILRSSLVDKGLGHTQMIRVTETVLAHREILAILLSCKFEEEDDE